MASSPTPSLDSIRGTNSVESYSENNGYLSDSPFTLSGSSPPVSDSAICEDFVNRGPTSSLLGNQHLPISASVSSSSSSSGLSGCGSSGSSNSVPGIIVDGTERGTSNKIISNNVRTIISDTNIVPRCTACKSKQSDAVAKCFECANFLCSNCVAAHEFMHCFKGHNVYLINGFDISNTSKTSNINSAPVLNDCKFTSSLSVMLQQEQNIQKHLSSKIAVNSSDIKSDCREDFIHKLTTLNGMDDFFPAIASLTNNDDECNKFSENRHYCSKHKNEFLDLFCRTCCVVICKDCIAFEHSSGLHDIEFSPEFYKLHTHGLAPIQISENIIKSVVNELREKVTEIVSIISNSDTNANRTKIQYQKAHNEINETYQFFCSMLDERKQELIKELESLYNAKMTSNNLCMNRAKDFVETVLQSCDAIERIPKVHNFSDILMLRKTFEIQHQSALHELRLPFELEFISNYQSIQAGVRNTFGYIRTLTNTQKQPPIARPSHLVNIASTKHGIVLEDPFITSSSFTCHSGHNDGFDNNFTKSQHSTVGNNRTLSSPNGFVGAFTCNVSQELNPYEKWSNGCSDGFYNNVSDEHAIQFLSGSLNFKNVMPNNRNSGNSISSFVTNTGLNCLSVADSDSVVDLTSKFLSTAIYPPKSQIKRQKMIYHCKFGEFGVMEGQFTEPSGVAVNAQNDIIVADTNNHRIQIFDKEGRFKFQFGECGKRDSQLLYPNRVAVVKTSGDIIVTERSPTHQIQIYNQYGQFVKKFGANILQHPRGVTVDNKGRIIVVECKVMRVIIFDHNGNVIQKFGCSKHLEFPNGVVVNDKQEIFISDNRAHCVKVFNYEGQYLRQIGGEGITNYPIGVGINLSGEILIADNHNNFNLTIFTQEGLMVSALESKVKHAQCFDVALMDDGSVVLASKDYRLYVYRYVQVPPPINL